MKKFLLVCEGPSDIAIFEEIANKLGGTIIEFQPSSDATTGQYPPWGWTQVKNWCLRIAANTSFSNPIEFYLKFKDADGIIIQIDTDIANEINIGGVTGVSGDKNWTRQAIDNWLGPRKGNPQVHYIVSTFSTEAWIAATYPNYQMGLIKGSCSNYETIQDPQQKLLSLGYKSDSSGDLKKNYKQYKKNKYAPRVVAHLSKARKRCSELEKLINLF